MSNHAAAALGKGTSGKGNAIEAKRKDAKPVDADTLAGLPAISGSINPATASTPTHAPEAVPVPPFTVPVVLAAALGFDLGTSPHGLAVDLPVSHQETLDAISCHSPAKPLLTFSLTESQRDALAFAALCEAESLEEGHEADEPEVQDAIRNLWEARHVLNGRPL